MSEKLQFLGFKPRSGNYASAKSGAAGNQLKGGR